MALTKYTRNVAFFRQTICDKLNANDSCMMKVVPSGKRYACESFGHSMTLSAQGRDINCQGCSAGISAASNRICSRHEIGFDTSSRVLHSLFLRPMGWRLRYPYGGTSKISLLTYRFRRYLQIVSRLTSPPPPDE
jgi:hypothetical protein